MNPELAKLHPYPFEKLAQLKQGCVPPEDKAHIALSIGEPKHPTPGFITEAVITHLHGLSSYPTTAGTNELRHAIATWLNNRFNLDGHINAITQVLPVNGTREALFAFAQAVIDRDKAPLVLMPNPFYQIYEGAAILAGAEPYYMNCSASHDFIPDFDAISEDTWQRCQLIYICSPGNPTGAVIDKETLTRLIELAHQYDFVIASDECYSEIYPDEANPPVGLLEAAYAAGYTDMSRCVVFHSLSKRSNAPGLRSGFVAGDADILKQFLRYRTYHGCSMPPATQAASITAWNDEDHVVHNRELYLEKFNAVLEILAPVMSVSMPQAGFYLWAETPIADTAFARQLFEQQNVTVLPGTYLGRDTTAGNPGSNHIRMALVAPLEECIEAAHRIRSLIESL
ncbi:MAG: succinyldiaminopimelate transaminase [Methylophaga sp.]|uniref:succinyldiaminopimelate transaminase n=1 Tax=Methylophaga sp. UBA678 TaxID=1946901 RepID=UPI000C5B4240|nr:succinyldiaminopimelate transaminase [Methylophaga sp. UBA678]MAX53202.1 succinyldiaminopimelate transaminase [Methylophaga sp.]|tara:strand:- start:72335 stop:73528 length:1194 start_codon:yes stop_codon:yes gene_type:complete